MGEAERCFICDAPTGRAGEDSIYLGHLLIGPWCEDCYDSVVAELLQGMVPAPDKARADAAERLAKADAAYVDVCVENAHCQDHEVQDTWELWCARRDARAAWRAIEGNEVTG